VVDSVSARLTTLELQGLNRSLILGSETPARIASKWLGTKELVER
jgi:glycine betaine/choline ABC-type transport system substrate-binding protein